MANKREEILKSLEPLFNEAEQKGLWFYCSYEQMWFTPKELKQMHSEDRFIWGEDNWELRNPNEGIRELETLKNNINGQIEGIKYKINNNL